MFRIGITAKIFLILVLIMCPIMGHSQEVRRATVDADSTAASLCFGTRIASSAMTFSYDAGTPPTATNSVMGVLSASSANKRNRIFSSWSAASGAYTSLTLKINSACTNDGSPPMNECIAQYSTNAGASWTTFSNVSSAISGQTTYSAVIPAATPLANLQVKICASADFDGTADTTTSYTVWDVWTEGVLAGGTSGVAAQDNHRRGRR